MKEDAAEEGETDTQPGVLQRVDPLEVRRLVDGDVPVDRHEDDDVDRAGHEGVDQGSSQFLQARVKLCLSWSLQTSSQVCLTTSMINTQHLYRSGMCYRHSTPCQHSTAGCINLAI